MAPNATAAPDRASNVRKSRRVGSGPVCGWVSWVVVDMGAPFYVRPVRCSRVIGVIRAAWEALGGPKWPDRCPTSHSTVVTRSSISARMVLPFELAAPPGSPALSWRELAMHAWIGRWRAICAGGAVLSMALLAAALISPAYRAAAVLAVLPSPEFTVRQAAGSHDSSASALALDQIMKAETEILGSDDLHAATLRRMGPATLYPDVFAAARPGAMHRLLHGIAEILLSPWRTPPADAAAARQEWGAEAIALRFGGAAGKGLQRHLRDVRQP